MNARAGRMIPAGPTSWKMETNGPTPPPPAALPEILRVHVLVRVPAGAAELAALHRALVVRCVPRREALSRPGDVARDLYFVESGCLRCHATDDRGIDRVLRFAVEGWWISDFHSYFTGESSSFGVDALEESRLLVLSREREQQLCADHPILARYFLGLLEGLAVATQRRLLLLLAKSVEARYDEFVTHYRELARRLPQHQIASYLGVTPESLSRVRARIAKRPAAPAEAATEAETDQ